MVQRFSAKQFAKFMQDQRFKFLESCKAKNNRNENTKEDIKLSFAYYPVNLKKYGYYFYNSRLNSFFWSKNK